MISLYPYCPPSFATGFGAVQAVRRIKSRGFPENLRNWRFITLTIDRGEYPDPKEAYELGKRHLRKFIYALRKNYSIRRWCWKLEMHKPDQRTGEEYPHWHLLLDYKRPIPCEEIEELWGKGRTEIKGVRDDGFDYLFKYVGKGLGALPDWLLAYHRVRFFQTSKGFFPAGCVATAEEEMPSPRHGVVLPDTDTQNEDYREVCEGVAVREVRDDYREPPETLGERIKRWGRSVVSRSESEIGTRYRLHIAIGETWADLLVTAAKHQLAQKLSCEQIDITKNKIQVPCQQYLPPNSLLYQMVSSS
jgi:hypothetical protein